MRTQFSNLHFLNPKSAWERNFDAPIANYVQCVLFFSHRTAPYAFPCEYLEKLIFTYHSYKYYDTYKQIVS